MGWFKKTLLWCAIALVIFTLFGFFAAPPILKSVLLKDLSASLNRDVSIGKISVNPFTLRLKIEKILIAEKGSKETLFSLDEMESKVSPAIIKGNIVLRRMYLKNPCLNIIRNDDGTYNISDLIEKKSPQGPAAGTVKKSTPLAFAFRGVVVENGSVDFLDGPLKKKHIVRELNLTVPFISNIPRDIKTDVQPLLSLKVNGSPYVIRGKTKPFADSRETSVDINIDNIDIPFYLAYLPITLPYRVVTGNLDIKLQLIYIDHENKEEPLFTLTGDVVFTKLAVHDATNKPILNLPALNITLHSVEPLAGKVHLAKVSIQSPEIMLRRDEQGVLNIPGVAPEKREGRTDKKGNSLREKT